MKKLFLACAALAASVALNAQSLPFMNPQLPEDQRIEDLLGRLTLQEKISMMQNASKGVERLGIPDYNWWNEALHGVARSGYATVFPQAIGMAATFDPELQHETFTIVSDEARAKYHQALREGSHAQYYGLTFWTPNINIFRDPRWGRGQETYGEDPFLTSQLGMATVKGLQGDDDKYLKAHACAKHFAVHSGPEWNRHEYNAVVSLRDLWETYLPAFKALVTEAGVQEVMGAYNRYDGQPCCSSDRLLIDILRDRWNYQGLVVSDCGAISDFYRKGAHEVFPDAATASAAAVLAGTDIECGSSYKSLESAVQQGLIKESDIDVSIRRILKGRFDLGMFDPDSMVPWSDIPFSTVSSAEHIRHAYDVARKSIVLMKNDGVLPLKPQKVKKIAVVGPNADNTTMLLGNYEGKPVSIISILDGIRAAYPDAEVTYERGCDLVEGYVPQRQFIPQHIEEYMGITEPTPEQRAKLEQERKEFMANQPKPMPSEAYSEASLKAMAARAAKADAIIFVGGLTPQVEGEEMRVSLDGFRGGDRERIELPEVQGKVLKALHATGKPVVFVMCTGSAVALSENENDYDALVNAWYGGQKASEAIADVLTGAYNPSGRLPVTFYKSTSQLPDFLDYSMRGRTYRYMSEEPLYPFGYGLSYTSFQYSKARLSSKKIKAGESVTLTLKLANTGAVDGDEIVQVYVRRLGDPNAPVKSLKGIKRVSLKAGESKAVSVVLPASSFEYFQESADDLVVKKGSYEILYGGSSSQKDLKSLSLVVN